MKDFCELRKSCNGQLRFIVQCPYRALGRADWRFVMLLLAVISVRSLLDYWSHPDIAIGILSVRLLGCVQQQYLYFFWLAFKFGRCRSTLPVMPVRIVQSAIWKGQSVLPLPEGHSIRLLGRAYCVGLPAVGILLCGLAIMCCFLCMVGYWLLDIWNGLLLRNV